MREDREKTGSFRARAAIGGVARGRFPTYIVVARPRRPDIFVAIRASVAGGRDGPSRAVAPTRLTGARLYDKNVYF